MTSRASLPIAHLTTDRMMSDAASPRPRPRLTRLVIDGFRGAPNRLEFDMDASAVLLWGPNGTGKTTLFDALQWSLLGDLPRLRGYVLRKNEEFISSTFSSGDTAVVEAHFRLETESMRVRRVGNSRGTDLEVSVGTSRFTGPNAEALLRDTLSDSPAPLSEALMTSGLLQQDELRRLLQTRPDERYRQLLGLLGLDVLERFDRFAKARRDRARDATRKAREDLSRLQEQIQSVSERVDTARLSVSRPTTDAADAPRRVLQAYPELKLVIDLSEPGAAARLHAATEQLARSINGHLSELGALPEELPDADPAVVEEAVRAVADRKTELEDAQREVSTARKSVDAATRTQDAVSRLAAAALPLLGQHTGDAPCPVCETVIDVDLVSERLRARAAAGAAVAAAEQVAAQAEDRLERASSGLASAESERTRLLSLAGSRGDAFRSLERNFRGITSLMTAAPSSGVALAIDSPLLRPSPETIDEGDLYQGWLTSRSTLLNSLQRVSDGLHALADAAAVTASGEAATRMVEERLAALPRLEAELASLRMDLDAQQADYESARRAETAANTLAQQTTSAATEIFQQRFATLQPLMNDIYSRLDPHPAFTHLDFRVEPYRTKGTAVAQVHDREANISANPMLIFSSAQANAVVLATFLALGWAARDHGLPFVLLDDPLQSLDDVNVLGFADITRHVRRQKQLVVATHDERFALLLERKLTGRADTEDLIVHEFRGWTRGGPIVHSRRVEPRQEPTLAVLAS